MDLHAKSSSIITPGCVQDFSGTGSEDASTLTFEDQFARAAADPVKILSISETTLVNNYETRPLQDGSAAGGAGGGDSSVEFGSGARDTGEFMITQRAVEAPMGSVVSRLIVTLRVRLSWARLRSWFL